MTFHYFGYGSNMLTERLRARCPSAEPIGVAEAADYALAFSKPSKDGSGKATLEHLEGGSQRSFGVIFKILLKERKSLDEAEGVGSGYERCDNFPVRLVAAGEQLTATCYLATEPDKCMKPYDWYLALTIAGALQHDLDAEYIGGLEQTVYTVDCKHERCARRVAIKALREAGFDDYHRLLPNDGAAEQRA